MFKQSWKNGLTLLFVFVITAILTVDLQATTWKAAPVDGDWNNTANWETGVPTNSAKFVGDYSKYPTLNAPTNGTIEIEIESKTGVDATVKLPAMSIGLLKVTAIAGGGTVAVTFTGDVTVAGDVAIVANGAGDASITMEDGSSLVVTDASDTVTVTAGDSTGNATLDLGAGSTLESPSLTLESGAGGGIPKVVAGENAVVDIDTLTLTDGGADLALTIGDSAVLKLAGHLDLTGVDLADATVLPLTFGTGATFLVDGTKAQSINLTNVDLHSNSSNLQVSNTVATVTVAITDDYTIGGNLTVDTGATAVINTVSNATPNPVAEHDFTVTGLTTVDGSLKIDRTGAEADKVVAFQDDVTIGGTFTLSSTPSPSSGFTEIQVAPKKTITVNEGAKVVISGVATNRLLLASSTSTIGQQFNIVNNGTLKWEWVAVRDSNYSGSGTIDFTGNGVVNATGNSNWPEGEFASPVKKGTSAIVAFESQALTGDSNYYDFYADTNGSIQKIDIASGASGEDTFFYRFAEGKAGSDAAVFWDASDTTAPADVIPQYYYIYLEPQATNGSDSETYLIVSDYPVNISRVAFIANKGDRPTYPDEEDPLTQPGGGNADDNSVFTSLKIDWTDNASPDATIELRYATRDDLVNIGDVLEQTTSIASVDATNDGDDGKYTWDTSDLATDGGDIYYIYALYSNGTLTWFDVSAPVTLKKMVFTTPSTTTLADDLTVDTATADNIVAANGTLAAHKGTVIDWSDWNSDSGRIDLYISPTVYTDVAGLRAQIDAIDPVASVTKIGEITDASATDNIIWDLTTGTGADKTDPISEAIYYIYAVCGDPTTAELTAGTGSAYDELVTASAQLTIVHNPFFYDGVGVTLSDEVDSAGTLTNPTPTLVNMSWKSGDVDDVAKVGIFYALSTDVVATPDNYRGAAEVSANATEAQAKDSDGALQKVSELTGDDLLEENSLGGFSGWNYYEALVPAGTYTVWVLLTDADGNQAFQIADNSLTVKHSSVVTIEDPIVNPIDATKTIYPYYTVSWTDVDYDEEAKIDLFYSSKDLLTKDPGDSSDRNDLGVGGPLNINQAYSVATETDYTKFTPTPIEEEQDGETDRYLFDLAGDPASPLYDNKPYYIYALVDSNADGNYEIGYQSGALKLERSSYVAVTTPSLSDSATLEYKVEWMEYWADPIPEGTPAATDSSNIPVNVDLYFANTEVKRFSDLQDFLTNIDPNEPAGMIRSDISLAVDDDGKRVGTNWAYWDDLIIDMHVASGSSTSVSGSKTTLIDNDLASDVDKYYVSRKLVFTRGGLSSSHIITNYDAASKTLTFKPPAVAAVASSSVTEYQIAIPDSTYYVYAVLDTSATLDSSDTSATSVNGKYNTAIHQHLNPVLGGTATGGTATTIVDTGLTDDPPKLYEGARVVITAGTNMGQSRTITGYNNTTQTLTVNHAFGAAIDTTSKYRIDVPEKMSVSVGSITINNHFVDLEVPNGMLYVDSYFDVAVRLDTNGQDILSTEIHIDYDAQNLEIADAAKPFSVFVAKGRATKDASKLSQLVSTQLSDVTDTYNDQVILITSGKAKGERRTIVDYDGATGTLTVDADFSTMILESVKFQITEPFETGKSITDLAGNVLWSPTVVRNTGENQGQVDFVAISTETGKARFSKKDPFIFVSFKTINASKADLNFSFGGARETHITDVNGEKHVPHYDQAVNVQASSSETSTVSGVVRLEGFGAVHKSTITFELRQPGSLGTYSGYTPPEGTDLYADRPGIQIETDNDGRFTLTGLPSGQFFLTAKATHHLRGQNHHSKPLNIRPGKFISGIRIHSYQDLNGDGDFDDPGEEGDELLAGDTGTLADKNDDNEIDLDDVTAFAANFLTAEEIADINVDASVDTGDFKLIARNYGATTIAPVGDPGVANAAPSIDGNSKLFGVELPTELQVGEDVTIRVDELAALTGVGFDLRLSSPKVSVSLDDRPNGFVVAKATDEKLLFAAANRDKLEGEIALTFKPIEAGTTILTIRNAKIIGDGGAVNFADVRIPITVRSAEKLISQSVLLQNYPNPFNPETWIPFELSASAEVQIRVFSANGGLVRTLELGQRASGSYVGQDRSAYWNGRNNRGELVSSGIYFYQLSAGDFVSTRKMVILK